MKVLQYLPRFRQARRAMATLAARERWSREQIERLQLHRLNRVWEHATAHVPYYRNLHAMRRLPACFESLNEFRHLVPILSRSQVQECPEQFRSHGAFRGRWRLSGGSTGRPTSFFWSHGAYREVMQAKYRLQQMWGLDIFDPFVFVWPPEAAYVPGVSGMAARRREPLADWLRNRVRLPASELGSEDLRRNLQRIERVRPAALYGFSTALYLLAQEALRVGRPIDSLRGVILTAEPAHDFMVKTVQQAFAAPTIVEYGATECGLIAGQAPDGSLRVREDIVLVETPPGDQGGYDVVLTVLVNPAFPLLRYSVGDVTDAPLERHAQGFATLPKIAGRQNDFLQTRSGRRIHPTRVIGLVEATQVARRYRIRQRADGSIHVQLEARHRNISHACQQIARDLEDAVEGFQVDVTATHSLEATSIGKHRWVVSELCCGAIEQPEEENVLLAP